MTEESFTYSYEVPIDSLELSLLPPEARQPGTDAFRKALTAVIEEDFRGFSGWARILVDDKAVRVAWSPKPDAPDPAALAIERLRGGDIKRGLQLLKLILPSRPEDRDVHFNLGMALSDQGQLDEAIKHLREALRISPAFPEAQAALGVALGRKGQLAEAGKILSEAVRQTPDNAYILRTLGGVLLKMNQDLPRAEACLRKATQLLPDDQVSWFGLAQAIQAQGRKKEAEEAFGRTAEINPGSDIAEQARAQCSRMAHQGFRAAPGGTLRMDAVEYCLDALKRFEQMPMPELQKVVLEIATLGTKGFDTSNPDKRYEIRSLPGKFSGLQMISMMYVGMKKFAPEADVGFDLSAEHRAALGMYDGGIGG